MSPPCPRRCHRDVPGVAIAISPTLSPPRPFSPRSPRSPGDSRARGGGSGLGKGGGGHTVTAYGGGSRRCPPLCTGPGALRDRGGWRRAGSGGSLSPTPRRAGVNGGGRALGAAGAAQRGRLGNISAPIIPARRGGGGDTGSGASGGDGCGLGSAGGGAGPPQRPGLRMLAALLQLLRDLAGPPPPRAGPPMPGARLNAAGGQRRERQVQGG